MAWDLSIHLLQLGSLSPPSTNGYAATVERWARFFTARTDDDLDRLASEHPIMALATQTLDDLSQDPETYRIARDRADALELYRLDLESRWPRPSSSTPGPNAYSPSRLLARCSRHSPSQLGR